ncbi:hypothetical protein BBJ28_00021722 [Nothophytophthora sp. Chile5]|nr:hypothetical protein BBJ28_00021722 [Nothophytophthora sp. Chile5]
MLQKTKKKTKDKMAESQMSLKIAFNGDIHRSRVDLRSFSLAQLTQLMAQTFRLAPGSFLVQYQDPEGDCVNVCSEAEFAEACRVFAGSADALKSLKFSAVTHRQAEFQEKVADPIVSSIETLMQALAVTLERVKKDGQFAVNETKQSAEAVDQAARESADSLKTAAGGFSSFAQGLVGEIKRFIPEKKSSDVPTAAAAVEAPVAPEAEQKPASVAPVAEPESTATFPPAPPVAVAVPVQEAEQPAVAFSDAETKWAEQLSIVSNIFPNPDVPRVIDMLEKNDGNINVVLNTLMEEN